jgi:hypothetical protein
MKHATLAVCFAGLLAAASFAPATATLIPPGKRFALVIGNSTYPGTALPGRADAEAMARELTQLGFTVVGRKPGETAVIDAKRQDMLDGLKALQQAIQDSGAVPAVVLFYFSGHGFQTTDGSSYLLPLASVTGSNAIADPAQEAISVAEVTQDLRVGDTADRQAAKIILLDACRSNAAFRIKDKLPPPGMAKRNFRTPAQTLIFYAANYGQTADGAPIDGNSPFTHYLLQHMDEAGTELRAVMKEVVVSTSAYNPRQVPVDDAVTNVPQPFYLRAPIEVSVAIDAVDDSVRVTAGLGNTLESSSPASGKFYLHSGENRFLIQVFNQKTYRFGQTFNMPEGWFYKVTLSLPGQAPRVFERCENVSDKDGPRFGKQFDVESVSLMVTGGQIAVASPWRLNLPPEEREDAVLDTIGRNIWIGGRAALKPDVTRCLSLVGVAGVLAKAAAHMFSAHAQDKDFLAEVNRKLVDCVHGNIWLDSEPALPKSCCDDYGC